MVNNTKFRPAWGLPQLTDTNSCDLFETRSNTIDMLDFTFIPNSTQSLRDLSHLEITSLIIMALKVNELVLLKPLESWNIFMKCMHS